MELSERVNLRQSLDKGGILNYTAGFVEYTGLVKIPNYVESLICGIFAKINSKLMMVKRVQKEDLYIEDNHLICGDTRIKIVYKDNVIPTLPQFFPADFGVNCPFQLPIRHGKSDKLIIIHRNSRQESFEVAESHRPSDLKREIVLLMIDEAEISSPITILGMLENRFAGVSEWIEPQYKLREWTNTQSGLVKILTYNILQARLGDLCSDWPHLKDEPEIDFKYRQQLISAELEFLKPDVFGLQEAEFDAIPASYAILQTEIPHQEKNLRMPNLVIGYNPEKFKPLDWRIIKYQGLANNTEKEVLQETKHMFLMAHFECLSTQKQLIFANTHLYFKEPKIRELQLRLLAEAVRRLNTENLPVVVVGDMNMDLKVNFGTILEHGFEIGNSKSVYTSKLKTLPQYQREQIASEIQESTHEMTLDGMFYGNCEQTGYLTNLSDDLVKEHDYMPSKMFPSDHLAQGFIMKI